MKCLIIDDVYAGIQETLSQKMDVENLYEAEWEGKPAKTPLTAAQLAEKIGDCDILIMRVDPAINADVLAAAKNLKFIGVCSVGLNHVNMEIAKEKGIIVQNAPGLNGNAVAELTIGKMLDLARQSIPAHRDVCDNHNWDKYAFMGHELRGATLGILGFGRIGQHLGVMAKAIGMDVIAFDIFHIPGIEEQLGIPYVEMDELLAKSDFISVHAPAVDGGALINAERIAKMKDGVCIINTSRGTNVDEAALLDALNSGKVRAAGLDVYADEPASNAALYSHPMVSCTPHIGAATVEAQKRIGAEIVDIITNFKA